MYKQYERNTFNMNNNWGFFLGEEENAQLPDFDDSKFVHVTIPHTMRLEKKHAGSASKVYQGIGWYRKHFSINSEVLDENSLVFLDFEGIMIDSEIYLNGEKIYERNGGYIGFQLDITDKIKEENILAIRVSSYDSPDTPPGKALEFLDFHYFGGIYRNVKLIITNKLFFTNPLAANKISGGGIFVSIPMANKDEAIVEIKSNVLNKHLFPKNTMVVSKLYDENNNLVVDCASEIVQIITNSDYDFMQTIKVAKPKLWHPYSPYLYTLVSHIYSDNNILDTIITKVGIRRIELKPDGFFINSEKLYIRGANRHQAYPYIGDAAPDSMQFRDALLLKEGGYNAVRAAHYPQAPAFLDACDKLGILVLSCQPGWQNFTKSQKFYDLTIRDVREMIRRDRNRPSVVLWETSLNETRYSADWAKDATHAAHQEMPGDQMFTLADYGLQGEYYDANCKIIDGCIDKNPDKTLFTREWGDWAGLDQARRLDGEARMIKQVNTHQDFLNGNLFLESDWGGLDASDRIAGYFLWSFNDYARGMSNVTLPSGVVDIDRYPKFLFYWLKSMMDASNTNYGPMVYIANYYTSSSSLEINVYSNCDCVRLYQNNIFIKEIERASLANLPISKNIMNKGGSPIFVFDLNQFVEGELRACGIINGNIVATHIVRTPKSPNRIKIVADLKGISPIADGSDLIPVYFFVTDENDTIIPNCNAIIEINVFGEGYLVGKNIKRISVSEQSVEAGIGFAFIQTTYNSGEIIITAKSSNLAIGTQRLVLSSIPNSSNLLPSRKNIHWQYDSEKFEPEVIDEIINITDESTDNEPIPGKIVPISDVLQIWASTPSVNNRPPSKMFDGCTLKGTGWLSSISNLPQYIEISFTRPINIVGSRIYWESDGSWYNYNIEFSVDNINWHKLIDGLLVGGQNYKPVFYNKVIENVSFVRITLNDITSNSGVVRVGLAEVVFYEDAANPCQINL